MTTKTAETQEQTLIQLPKMDLPEPKEVKEKMDGAVNDLLAQIDKEIAETPVDISTKEGRGKLISLSANISKTKVAADNQAKETTETYKAVTSAVDAARKVLRDECDKRRDAVRAPVTAWEQDEKARKAESDAAFEFLYTWKTQTVEGRAIADMSADALHAWSGKMEYEMFPADASVFLEETENYEALFHQTVKDIAAEVEKRRTLEAEKKELEELRAMKAEKEAAEAKAKAEAEDVARRARMKEEAEAKAKADAERELAEAKARAEQAERDKIAAEERAKIDAQKAAERAKQEERDRAEAEALAAQEEENRKAADLKNRKAKHNAIVVQLERNADISEAQARRVIQAIDDGKVTNLKIIY